MEKRRWVMDRKGSYFFVIDAFIASIIIVIGLIIIFSRYNYQPSATQIFHTAEDFLSTASTTEIRNFDNEAVRTWITTGAIPDAKISILEQIVLFNLTETPTNGVQTKKYNLSAFIGNNTPPTVNLILFINGSATGSGILFIRNSTPAESANVMFTAKRIITLKNSATSLHQPAIVEARTWQ